MTKTSPTIARTTLALLLGLTLAACAGGPPQPVVDYRPEFNFAAVKTIAFHSESGEVFGDNPLQLSDMQRDRINTAMSLAVNNHGLQMVDDPADADLLLSWHLVTQYQTDIRQTGGYGYGYGLGHGYFGGGHGYYGGYGGYGGGSGIYSRSYTQGKFIVDMVNPADDKSVWRGITESRLKTKPERDQVKYNEAASAILAAFPRAS